MQIKIFILFSKKCIYTLNYMQVDSIYPLLNEVFLYIGDYLEVSDQGDWVQIHTFQIICFKNKRYNFPSTIHYALTSVLIFYIYCQ